MFNNLVSFFHVVPSSEDTSFLTNFYGFYTFTHYLLKYHDEHKKGRDEKCSKMDVHRQQTAFFY